MIQHISQGGLEDFHTCLLEDCDKVWRGRISRDRRIVTVIPPLIVYAGENFRMPEKLVKAIRRNFKPLAVLVETKGGYMRFLKHGH